ncbi:MAG: hypothetical protein PHC89_02395 [Candidatus Pacebacteria bacterium]|nr:hypothetical protein [Candidatus Paceibacterota bacterium]
MKLFLRNTITLAILLTVGFLTPSFSSAQIWGGGSGEGGTPTGEALSSIQTGFPTVNNGIVEFRAQYTAEPMVEPYTGNVITWFRFGPDPSALAYSSEQKKGSLGTHVVTQGATNFPQNTVFYVEAYLALEGQTYSGGVVDFNTGEAIPPEGSTQGGSNGGDFSAGYGSVDLTPSDTIKTGSALFSGTQTVSGKKPIFSFNIFDFFKKFRLPTKAERNKKKAAQQDLMSQEEKDAIVKGRTHDSVSEFSQSASNDTEEGEIVRVAPYTPGVTASNEGSLSTGIGVNYLFLIIVILMLFGAVVLFYLITRKKNQIKRRNNYPPYELPTPYGFPPYDDPERGPEQRF